MVSELHTRMGGGSSRYMNGDTPTKENVFDPVLKIFEKRHTCSGTVKDFAVKDMQ